MANFPHIRILKTRTVGHLTVHFSLILFCRKSNEKQIIGHYLAPPLNLTCKVPMFIEQSFALTLASFVSKSPFSQKKKKNSHPPLVWSDLIVALQNPRLEKMFTLNLFLRADLQMKQAYAGAEPVEWHITAPLQQHVSFYVLMIHARSLYVLGKCSPTPPLSQH